MAERCAVVLMETCADLSKFILNKENQEAYFFSDFALCTIVHRLEEVSSKEMEDALFNV